MSHSYGVLPVVLISLTTAESESADVSALTVTVHKIVHVTNDEDDDEDDCIMPELRWKDGEIW